MPRRDSTGRFLPLDRRPGQALDRGTGQAPPEVTERDLLERIVLLLERLVYQTSGTPVRWETYRKHSLIGGKDRLEARDNA